MSAIDDLGEAIATSIEILARRRRTTSDEQERRVIDEAMNALEGQLTIVNQASSLQAADALSNVGTELEKAVAAIRVGPFDGYLSAIEKQIVKLNRLSDRMHAREALAPAVNRGARGKPKAAARGSFTPINSKDFAVLAEEYQRFYDACVVRPEFEANVRYYVKRATNGTPTYELVAGAFGMMPWQFVAVTHGMECGFNFTTHLHNGDPLTARTVHVPAGRPKEGTPPFAWVESARDALRLKKLDQVAQWSIPRMLFQLEGFNGFGYRSRGIATPYLWSFSQLYEKGKFVADGKYDPEAVSKQCGAALVLKALGV